MQFLDPTNDLVFKKIFGNEKKKEILISFLNSILRLKDERTIHDVILLNPTQAPRIKGAKESILDVRCYDQRGTNYIVEMQVLGQVFFDKRVLYYASKAYSDQLGKGDTYQALSPVIFLGILNFNFTQSSRCISTHTIHDVETKEHVFQDFRFTLAELPKFNKTVQALETVEDKWLYFLKQAKALTAIPAVIHEQAIQDAFEIAKEMNWNTDELAVYERRALAIEDEIQRINYGYQAGEKKGKVDEKLNTAKNMLSIGLSIEQVMQVTGLSEEQLNVIKEQVK